VEEAEVTLLFEEPQSELTTNTTATTPTITAPTISAVARAGDRPLVPPRVAGAGEPFARRGRAGAGVVDGAGAEDPRAEPEDPAPGAPAAVLSAAAVSPVMAAAAVRGRGAATAAGAGGRAVE
jgi:hypothetical protein